MSEESQFKKRIRIKMSVPLSPSEEREHVEPNNLAEDKKQEDRCSIEEVKINCEEPICADSGDEETAAPTSPSGEREKIIRCKVVGEIEKQKNSLSMEEFKISHQELSCADMIFDRESLETNTRQEPPIPAPRRGRTPETHLDEITSREENSPTPPRPAPRIKPASPAVQEHADDTHEGPVNKKVRRKKRKAAEIIANVLRRESKKTTAVTTALQESSEDIEKDYNGMYSPWDSPPPPATLEKVYIQHKYGFSVRDWGDLHNKQEKSETPRNKCVADVALAFHSLWSRLSVFSHGIVAGFACCHALAVAAALAATQSNIPSFVQFYHFLSLKIHFAVYVFTSLCIISCLDRLDLGHFNKKHLAAMGRSHGTLLVTFGYLMCLALSLAAHRHTAAIEAYASDNSLWNARGLEEWTCLVTVRDGLLLLCWVFMSCSAPRDFLQENLMSLCTSRLPQEQKQPDLWHVPSEA